MATETLRRAFAINSFAVGFLFALVVGISHTAFAADHLDSPIVKNDPAADLADVYAFVNPNDSNEVLLAITGVPMATRNSRFSDAVDYLVHFDNGSGDRVIKCNFTAQSTHVDCSGPGGLSASGPLDQIVAGNGMRVFAGLADDPFFFDLTAFNATKATLAPQFHDPGDDSFAGLNVMVIVLGIQRDKLEMAGGGGSSVFKVYGSTKRTGELGVNAAFTGSWYDPAHSGHGVQVEILTGTNGEQLLYGLWNVYNPAGEQAWVTTIGPLSGNGTGVQNAYITANGAFPPVFGAGQPQVQLWGTLKFDFSGCDHASMTYVASGAGWGSGTIALTRLTRIAGSSCHLLVGGQIDRMGRPGINTALINLLPPVNESLKDAYNQAESVASWAQFTQEIQNNLAAIDTLDGVVGNTVLPPTALAPVLADDRLIIDVSKPACDAYLAVELGVNQCGGRTLRRDVIDDTLGAIVGPGVSDYVAFDSVLRDDFPFFGTPN